MRGTIDSTPPELVPYYLLTPRERQVVQYTADGLSSSEMADKMGISVKTVDAFKHNMSHMGTGNRSLSWYEGKMVRTVMLALIQDGVTNKYIQHAIGETKIKPLSLRENEVLDAICQGMKRKEIAAKFAVSIKTIESQMHQLLIKLGTRNFYHAVARSAYLKLHGNWRVSNYVRKTLDH